MMKKRILSGLLCVLTLLCLGTGIAPAVYAETHSFSCEVGQTEKELIGSYGTNLSDTSVSVKITSGSDYVSNVKASSEIKGSKLDLYLHFTGKKAGKAKLTYTFSYSYNNQKYSYDWPCEIEVSKGAKYPYTTEIFVDSMPKQTVYEVGESFDETGLCVGYKYVASDGNTHKDILADSAFSCNPTKFTKAGKQKVTVTAKMTDKNGDKKKFTCTFEVTVKAASKKPTITKHPYGESVAVGDDCYFTAHADNADSVTWYFVSTDGAELKAKNASTVHQGLKVSGYNEDKLKLSNVPASLNGWSVYAAFTNTRGSTDTKKAGIFIQSSNMTTLAPTFTPTPTPTNTPTPMPTAVPVNAATTAPVLAATLSPEEEENGTQLSENRTAYAFGSNCLINGYAVLPLNGETIVRAVPSLPEGMMFESWKVNGELMGSEPELILTLTENTLIEAVYHPEKVITCINCYFQFANKSDRAAGDKLETFSFEQDYANPVTGEPCTGGLLTGYVTASVPKNKTVDYWIINGVEYHFNNTVKYFRIVDLDEATTYEVVFKGASKKKTTTAPGDRRPDPTPFVVN